MVGYAQKQTQLFSFSMWWIGFKFENAVLMIVPEKQYHV